MELVWQHLVEPLADAVDLRAPHLGPGVVDVLDGEVELILVPILGAAILGTAIGENLVDPELVLIEEAEHAAIHARERDVGAALLELVGCTRLA